MFPDYILQDMKAEEEYLFTFMELSLMMNKWTVRTKPAPNQD